MCTVTFVPLKSGAYFLTSNRDEYISRSLSNLPETVHLNQYDIIYPKDPKGGGTWIATDNRGITVCLLNGADIPHQPVYPYRHSRGLVVLDYFKFDSFNDFMQFYELDSIEPFTLVILQSGKLIEFKWDGHARSYKNFPKDKPRIWSSVTLYGPEIVDRRKDWFDEWLLKHPGPELKELLHFHKNAGEGDKKIDVMMERVEGLRTVSITSIKHEEEVSSIYYEDLITDQVYTGVIEYQENIDNL